MSSMNIEPPFKKYNRANLERLVREGFESIEKEAVKMSSATSWGTPSGLFMDPNQFQILVAADYFLRTSAAGNG